MFARFSLTIFLRVKNVRIIEISKILNDLKRLSNILEILYGEKEEFAKKLGN